MRKREQDIIISTLKDLLTRNVILDKKVTALEKKAEESRLDPVKIINELEKSQAKNAKAIEAIHTNTKLQIDGIKDLVKIYSENISKDIVNSEAGQETIRMLTEIATREITAKTDESVRTVKNAVDEELGETRDEIRKVVKGLVEISNTAKAEYEDVVKISKQDFKKNADQLSAQIEEKTEKTIKSAVENQLKTIAEEYIGKNFKEVIYGIMESFLTEKVRNVVIGNDPEGYVTEDALNRLVTQITRELLKSQEASATSANSQRTNTEEIKPFDKNKELVHYQFGKLLECITLGVHPMLVGPAGTGKSTAVEQAARVLGLRFYMANRVSNTYELTGYNDAEGRFVETEFYRAYKNGGVFFFDEIDGSDPEALVTINTAIAQGYTTFPCGQVKMHPDFKLVAAGNTYGTGADAEYCGRNQLDSATLDRFAVIDWGYDRKLERKLCPDNELLEFVWSLRDVCEKNHLKIIISTRGLLATYKLSKAKSFTLAENLRANLLEGIKPDTLNVIKGGLKNEHNYTEHNEYIEAITEIVNKEKSK